MAITHTFVSAKTDSVDTTLVRPSNWNDDHTVADFGASIVVAASNASDATKAAALASGGGVCDGTADDVEIQAAIDACGVGEKVVCLGVSWVMADTITITKSIFLEIYGSIQLAGNDFIQLGSSATNPQPGRIFIAQLTGTDTESAIVQISGCRWNIEILEAWHLDMVWEWAPVAQGSDKWYESNWFHLGIGQDIEHYGWYIPSEPAHVFIEGNRMDCPGAIHAGLPIYMLGSAWNSFFGGVHPTDYGQASPADASYDISDSGSRGGNSFFTNYSLVAFDIHSNSLLITGRNPSFTGDLLKSTSFTNRFPNGDFEVGNPPILWTDVGGSSTIAQETTIVKTGYASLKITSGGAGGRGGIDGSKFYWADLKGRKVTFGAWFHCPSTNSGDFIQQIYDNVTGATVGSTIPADDTYYWRTVSATIASAAATFKCWVSNNTATDICYVDGATLCEGGSCPAPSPNPNESLINPHTAAYTLSAYETGYVLHTNLGAGGAVTITLPQTVYAGFTCRFAVMTAQELRIDPGAAGAIYINGAKQTDDKYITANDEAESVILTADGNGDWIASSMVGTWGVEA